MNIYSNKVLFEEKDLYENADFILMYNKKNFAGKIREFLEKCGREN
jgi:hypothetical protein